MIYQQPHNFELPLKIDYEYIYMVVNPNYQVVQTISFSNFILKDNYDWLLLQEKSSFYYKVGEVKSTSIYMGDDE